MRPIQHLLIVALGCVLLGACASSPERDFGFRIVVSQSVQRYIWNAPAEQRDARAERIREVAGQIRALASDASVTVALLKEAASREIGKHDLIPPDRALITDLVDEIVAGLQARVGDGPLSGDALVRVTDVLDWVIDATAAYTVQNTTAARPIAGSDVRGRDAP